ncbi:MAG: acyl-CoA/acyl-ACP dehydrogenase [Planctomycetes bacterium]|nr:acyl-CoA/acyl-ACP dehydrogenase [Planctomycetota bacterium]
MAFDFSFSEEVEQVRGVAKSICDKLAPQREKLIKDIHVHRKFPHALWDAAAEAGFLGCLISEKYGGNEMGMLPLAVAVEEMAVNGYGNAFFVVTNMDASCIAMNGSEAVKQKYLPKIASGACKMAFAVTEPDAGSNTFRITTYAKDVGDHFELKGQKTFITGVDESDAILVVARTKSLDEVKALGQPKTFGLSIFVVDSKSPGIELSLIPTHGIEGMNQFTIHFDQVKVPKENLVGELDMGTMALFTSLNPERILAAAAACGMTQFCLNRASRYANERVVFGGKPIGSYQALAHPLAESCIDLEAARLLLYKACWNYDSKKSPFDVGSSANYAKFFAAEMAIRAVDRAIETHGGYGFSEEYELVWLWTSARLLRTAPISREMILNYVSEHNLGLPRSY